MRAFSAKVARFVSISGREGNDELPSMIPGISAERSGSSERRLFQSYHS